MQNPEAVVLEKGTLLAPTFQSGGGGGTLSGTEKVKKNKVVHNSRKKCRYGIGIATGPA